MTLEQAYKLLHPDIPREIKVAMFTDHPQEILAIKEACEVACKCIKKCMESEDDLK